MKYKKMKKILLITGIVVIMLLISIILYNTIMYPSMGEDLEVDFYNSKYNLNNDEVNEILNILGIDKDDYNNIKIDKISYNVPFRHESYYDIYFTMIDTENIKRYNEFEIVEKNDKEIKYKYEKGVDATFLDENFKKIKKICDKYYKYKIHHI